MRHTLLLASAALLIPTFASAEVIAPTGSPVRVELSTQAQVSTVTDTLVINVTAEEISADLDAANAKLFSKLNKSLQALRDSGKYELSALTTNQFRQYVKDNKYRWVTTGNFTIKTKSTKDIPALNKAMSELSDSYANVSPNFLRMQSHMELSDAGQLALQKSLIAAGANAFKDKAQAVANAFGYTSYNIVSLNLDNASAAPIPMFRGAAPMMAMAKAEQADSMDNQVPGDVSISTVINGTIQLVR